MSVSDTNDRQSAVPEISTHWTDKRNSESCSCYFTLWVKSKLVLNFEKKRKKERKYSSNTDQGTKLIFCNNETLSKPTTGVHEGGKLTALATAFCTFNRVKFELTEEVSRTEYPH